MTKMVSPAGLWAGAGAPAEGCGCHWGTPAALPFGLPLAPPKAGKLSASQQEAVIKLSLSAST